MHGKGESRRQHLGNRASEVCIENIRLDRQMHYRVVRSTGCLSGKNGQALRCPEASHPLVLLALGAIQVFYRENADVGVTNR